MTSTEKPRILINAKDHPDIASAYGTIVKNLAPRLAKVYGEENIFIYAPVYNRDRVETWRGISVLPGVDSGFENDVLLMHYQERGCTMLLQIGDWVSLRLLPAWAAQDKVVWVQWAPYDWLETNDVVKQLIKLPLKMVPFCKYAYDRLMKDVPDAPNVTAPILIGLDLDIWHPIDRANLPEMMSSLGFSETSYNILMVQANQKRKYILEQLEAIKLFRQANPDVDVRLYFHTNIRADYDLEYELSIRDLWQLTKTPSQYSLMTGGLSEQQMSHVFNCADLVLDVCFEGFGMSMTQAQAVGVAAIGLSEGPTLELVRFGASVGADHTDYNAGLGKPVAAPEDIAYAIQNAYELPERRSTEAVEWVLDNLSWDKITDQWVAIIDEVHELRDKHTMFIPEPSQFLKDRADRVVEVTAK